MSRQNHKHIQEVGNNRKAPNKFSADNNLEVTQYATVAKSLQEVGSHIKDAKMIKTLQFVASDGSRGEEFLPQ